MEINPSTPPEIKKPYSVRQPWAELVEALKAHPGVWFEVSDLGYKPRMVQVTASRMRRGGLKAFTPAGHFETRHDYKNIWVRFVGDKG